MCTSAPHEAPPATRGRVHVASARLAALVLASLAIALLLVPAPAPAATLADRQAEAERLDEEVLELEQRVDQLRERLRGERVQMRDIQADIEETRRELEATRRDLAIARERLADRAVAIYQRGEGAEMIEAANAGSITEFFERIEAVQRVGEQDADVLERVRDLAERVADQEQALEVQLGEQREVVARAAKAEAEVDEVLTERRERLDSVTAEIRQIMEQQRRERQERLAAEARAAAQEVEADDDSTSEPRGGSAPAEDAAPAEDTPALPPPSSGAAGAASVAMSKIGSPYVYGAAGPDSFDCSGLVMWSFAQVGISLPRTTYDMVGIGTAVPDISQAQVGDLVFTNSTGHMGIYVGGGNIVHSPQTGDVVKVSPLSYFTVVAIRRV